MELLVIAILLAGVILIPLTLIPHTYRLLHWRRYPVFPAIRFKSAVWGAALMTSLGWQVILRIDILYNNRAWFGTLETRSWLDAVVNAGILVAIIVNTIVYYIIIWRKRADDYAANHG